MKQLGYFFLFLLMIAFTAAACNLLTTPSTATPTQTPTQPPSYQIEAATLTPTALWLAPPTSTPFATATATPTFAPLAAPKLNLLLRACTTSVDLSHRMGEVTNAYILVQNLGNADATRLTVTLSANDEERPHPDKSFYVQFLPPGYEIALKLTVDTANQVETSVSVVLTTAEGIREEVSKSGCSQVRPDRDLLAEFGELFKVRPINR